MTRPVVYGDIALHIVSWLPGNLSSLADMSFTEVDLTVGGTAGTVCWQMAELGYPPQFIGVTGNDWAGSFVASELARRGVDCSRLEHAPLSTTRVLVLVEPGGDRKLVVGLGATWSDSSWRPEEPPWTAPRDTLAYIPGFPDYESSIVVLHARGARLIADLGFLPLLSDKSVMQQHALKLAPYLEVMVLNGEYFDEQENRDLAYACLQAGTRVVLNTLGPNGVIVTTSETKVHLPAFSVQVQNTLCAGDAFAAGFMVALTEGQSLLTSAQYGQAVAAVKLTRLSTLPTRDEVEAFLRAQVDSEA